MEEAAVKFVNHTPMLATGDMDLTIDFYKDALGFEPGDKFESSSVIWWCEMQRDDITLMFTQHETHTDLPGAQEGFEQTSINFYVDDIEELYETLQKKGYQTSDMRVTFYRMKEFDMKDPTGYTLLFGQPTDEPPTVEDPNPAPF
jgi:uncharacterized glyoxalase superfamily protein PhnB